MFDNLFKSRKKTKPEVSDSRTDTDTTRPPAKDESAALPISVQGVTKSFGDFVALQNISFELAKGECLGIIGLNGAGKSTLLSIIAGALKPTSGKVITHGRIVAMLELGTGFNPDYTGLENIYMNASVLGIPRKVIDQKLPDIEAFAEIGEFIHRPVKTYSSGMAVRLAFSLFTQVDPDIMIIDEALSVGDAYFSHKCMKLIRNFRDCGKTFLFVSHNPAAIKSLCDRAILLEKGVITKSGSPVQVLDYYNAIISKKEEEALLIEQKEFENRTVTRSGNGKARITFFELLDQNDKPKRVFETGDPLKVFCSVRAYVTLENPTLGFLIKDKLGNDTFGTNTHHLKFNSGTINQNETLDLVFETKLDIGPGEYSVTLATHEGDRHLIENYDWFDGVVIFRVVPRADEFFAGVARLPTTVSIADSKLSPTRKYSYGNRISTKGENSITQFLTRGWSLPESEFIWSDQKRAEILLDVDESDSDRTLRIELHPFLQGETESQNISLIINEAIEKKVRITQVQIVEIPIEKSILTGKSPVSILIDIPDADRPSEGNDQRTLGVALHYFEII